MRKSEVSKQQIERFAEKQTKDSMDLEYSGEILEAEIVDTRPYVEYDSNNSGGSFWLTDEAWVRLEDAGWEVAWAAELPEGQYWGACDYKNPRPDLSKCDVYRWLGTVAHSARKRVESAAYMDEAVWEWQRLTGERAEDEGCSCCGPPHSFRMRGPNGEYIW